MEAPGGSITRLRYTNDGYELIPLTFKNEKGIATVIEKSIDMIKPTFFRYNVSNGTTQFRHQFLAFPGDTIRLKFDRNGDIAQASPTDKPLFFESFMNVDYQNEHQKNTTNQDELNQIKQENQKRIADKFNSKIISKRLYDALNLFSEVKYYLASTSSVYKNPDEDNEELKNRFAEIEDKFEEFKKINAYEVFSLYENLVTYKYNAQPKKSLTEFIKVTMANDQADITKALIKNKMDQQNDKASMEYINAVNYLNTRGHEYGKINFISKDILELPLYMENGKTKSLKEELTALPKNGLIILDFWASWCIPCIYEFPFVKKHKVNLEKLNIRFIPISIDADKDIKDWLAISKKHNSLFATKNYRLLDKDKKKMIGFFKITTIPRYIILDKNAMIIDHDFTKPSNSLFVKNLLNYQKEYAN